MVTDFPSDSALIKSAFKFFDTSSNKIILQYLPIVFLARIIFNQATLRGKEQYSILLRDTVLVFVGMMCFKRFISIVLKIPEEAESLIDTFGVNSNLNHDIYGQHIDWGWGPLAWGDVILGELLKKIAIVFYWIIYWLYTIFIFISICLGSYVIFFGLMFNVRWVLSAFIITITIASMWPIIWYAADYALVFSAGELQKEGAMAGILSSSIVLNLLKIIFPVGGFLWAMKNPVQTVGNATNGIKETFQRLKNNTGTNAIKSTLSKGLELTGTNQVLSRFKTNSANRGLASEYSSYINSKPNNMMGFNEFKALKYGRSKNYKPNMMVNENELEAKILKSNQGKSFGIDNENFKAQMSTQIKYEVMQIKSSGSSRGIGTNKIEQKYINTVEKKALNSVLVNNQKNNEPRNQLAFGNGNFETMKTKELIPSQKSNNNSVKYEHKGATNSFLSRETPIVDSKSIYKTVYQKEIKTLSDIHKINNQSERG